MRYYIFATIVVTLVIIPVTTGAFTATSGRNVFVDSSTEVKGVYVAGGGTLDLAGKFDDDVIVGGGTVSISGPVAGDVIVGGGTAKVTGDVKGSVRVAAGTVELDTKVGRNVILMGGTLTIGKSADVAGETSAFGGTLVIEGHTAKEINAWAGSIVVNGSADADVVLHTTDDCGQTPCVTVGPNAVINGKFTYWASRDAKIDSGATISGPVTRNDITKAAAKAKKILADFITLARLWNLFSLLVVGALIALLFPRTVRSIGERMVKRTGASVGWGALIFLATPVAMILLPLTVIGIPLALIVVALYFIALYVSQVFLGFVVGEWILRRLRRSGTQMQERVTNPIWPTLIGIVVVSLVLDFLLGYAVQQAGFALGLVVSVVRLFLIVWPFGALILVKWQLVKEREQ